MIWSSKEKGVRQVARVLLIEDNNDIQEILYSLLSEDHEVLQAFSGTEGLRLFQQESIDLVLLDIMLPGKNGPSGYHASWEKWGSGPGGDPFAESSADHHDDRSWRQTPH